MMKTINEPGKYAAEVITGNRESISWSFVFGCMMEKDIC
jgi:hypothetical protein